MSVTVIAACLVAFAASFTAAFCAGLLVTHMLTGISPARRLPLRCRVFGHRWKNVRAWDPSAAPANFCCRCGIAEWDA